VQVPWTPDGDGGASIQPYRLDEFERDNHCKGIKFLLGEFS
jgi:hypothetical protein